MNRHIIKTVIDHYKQWKDKLLFLAILFVTLGNSQGLMKCGVNQLVEYLGLALLLVGCFARFVQKKLYLSKRKMGIFLIILVLFNLGLMLQHLSFIQIIRLIISMGILAILAYFPSDFLRSIKDVKNIGEGILVGTLITTVIALFTGCSVFTRASEGFLIEFGFNGGFEHRNYFSYAMIASFISFYTYYKYGRKEKKTVMGILLSLGLLILTNSRGAYIVFAAFICMDNCTKIRIPWCSKKTSPTKVALLASIIAIPIYVFLVTHSETFFFRINGLINYMKMYSGDMFHMIFGNAEMAFRQSGMSYDENIRSIIGWNGSVELVVLNVLIKNGLLGIIGYLIIFYGYFRECLKMRNRKYQSTAYALVLSFVLSAFVESFLANINYVYSVCCYTMIAGMLPVLKRKDKRKRKYERLCEIDKVERSK